MGSKISLLNDTDHTWLCRTGPDEKALKISGIVGGGLLGLGAAIVAAGQVATVVAGGVTALIGIPSTSLATGMGTMTVVGSSAISGGAASIAVAHLSRLLNQHLIHSKGFREVAPGESFTSGTLSLSLWQQGTCVYHTTDSPTQLTYKTLYMRPIFSGVAAGSVNTYSIKKYLEGKGQLEEETIKVEEDKRLNIDNLV